MGTQPSVHLVGIGGTAMVSCARLALEAGWEVRGSDNPLYPPASQMVERLGVPVFEGYAATNLDWNPDRVIIGNALSRGNAEVEAVLEQGLYYQSMAEWIKDEVLRTRQPIVITGTHGKTTTTALTAYLLDRLGHAPGYLIGGQPLDFDHSARLSARGGLFVIEGDEYDTAFFDKRAKFLHYLPRTAVVTSVEFDHGDIYDTIEAIELAFQRMLRQIPASGHLLLCADAPRALALRDHAFCNVLTYGMTPHADWFFEMGGNAPEGQQAMRVFHQGNLVGMLSAPIAGRHNFSNLLAAYVVARLHGATHDAIAEHTPSIKGVRRRMELFLEHEGAQFIDDFAHHPTAVRETLAAARQRWPERRITAVFEPRSNTTVTNRFQDELGDALAQADCVWIGPIHRADSIPEGERLDRQSLCDTLNEKGLNARSTDDVQEIVDSVTREIQPNDLVLFLSNGAFGGIYAKLKQAVKA